MICALAALALRASASEAAQRQALMDLFEATHGDQWLERGGWGSSTLDYCGWFGITCVRGNVTKLDLHSNNLAGPVPASIEKLTHLDDLRMASKILLVGPFANTWVSVARNTPSLFQISNVDNGLIRWVNADCVQQVLIPMARNLPAR